MTMQDSHEYHLVQHYRSRLSVAHAEKARADAALLALAAQPEVRMSDLEVATTRVFRASREIAASAALLDEAEAALNEAYPADVQVVAAIEAVKAAHDKRGEIRGCLEASYTDEQNALIEAEREAEAELDAAVIAAKKLIEAAGVSPVKAFSVRTSVKSEVIVEANRAKILADVLDDWLPASLVTIDEAALVAWIEENPDAAQLYDAVIERRESRKVTVAFYEGKL